MSARLRAAVLLAAMLTASLAPTAVVSLHADEGGMGCCAGEEHCDGAAMKRACCPCAPTAPADPPSAARAVQVAPQAIASAPWQSTVAEHPGAIGPDEGQRFARLVTLAAPSPPWLLHGAFLI